MHTQMATFCISKIISKTFLWKYCMSLKIKDCAHNVNLNFKPIPEISFSNSWVNNYNKTLTRFVFLWIKWIQFVKDGQKTFYWDSQKAFYVIWCQQIHTEQQNLEKKTQRWVIPYQIIQKKLKMSPIPLRFSSDFSQLLVSWKLDNPGNLSL